VQLSIGHEKVLSGTWAPPLVARVEGIVTLSNIDANDLVDDLAEIANALKLLDRLDLKGKIVTHDSEKYVQIPDK
jgi:hypothetical protein